MISQTSIYAGLSDTLGETDNKRQRRKHHDTGCYVNGNVFVDPVNGDGCRWVGHEE